MSSKNELEAIADTSYDDWLEVNENWLPEARRRVRFNYESWINFSQQNNLDTRDVMQFKNGNPVIPDVFKKICDILDFDWKEISI